MSDVIKREVVAAIRAVINKDDDVSQVSESYVVQPRKYALSTEKIGEKTKGMMIKRFEEAVANLNTVSAKLDTANKEAAGEFHSDFRSLKFDESSLLSRSFLTAMTLENISDLDSKITMDSLPFLRLDRDFQSFDNWQRDFIACGKCITDGFVACGLNVYLKKYTNIICAGPTFSVPVGFMPILVLAIDPIVISRNFSADNSQFIASMMKEIDWDKVSDRIKKSEKFLKIL